MPGLGSKKSHCSATVCDALSGHACVMQLSPLVYRQIHAGKLYTMARFQKLFTVYRPVNLPGGKKALPASKPAVDFFTIVLPLGKTILPAGRSFYRPVMYFTER